MTAPEESLRLLCAATADGRATALDERHGVHEHLGVNDALVADAVPQVAGWTSEAAGS